MSSQRYRRGLRLHQGRVSADSPQAPARHFCHRLRSDVAREHDGGEGRNVVPGHHPLVKSSGVVLHEIKQGIGPEQREGPVVGP